MIRTLQVNQPGEVESRFIHTNQQLEKTELRLKPIYGGICGSDVGVYKGKLGHAKYPVVPGHEVVAEVIEKGVEAAFEVGTKVVIVPNSFCDACENCLKGKRNICLHKESLGVNTNGVFSEHFIIDAKYVIALPEGISLQYAALTEPFAVVVHAFKNITVHEQIKIAIIGCGTEGMLAVSLADYYNANITVIDVQQEKLVFIQEQFPNIQVCSPNEVENQQYDIVIECAGVKSAFEQAIQIVKAGGEIIVIGFTPEATIPVTHIVRNEIKIQGSIIYDFPVDFENSLAILADPKFKAQHIISKMYDIEQFKDAYADACSGKYGKVLLKF